MTEIIPRNTFVYIGLWANKPVVSTLAPYRDRIFITDVGQGGSEWYSDASRYRVAGGQVVLSSVTGNTYNTCSLTTSTGNESTLLTASIGAGVLQVGDVLHIEFACTSSATTSVVPKVKINGTSFTAGGTWASATTTPRSQLTGLRFDTLTECLPIVVGASSYGDGGSNNPATITLSDISANAQTVLLNMYQNGTIATTITLRHCTLTLKTCG